MSFAKKLEVIEKKIRRECVCGGPGCNTCRDKISRIRRYEAANIPVEYWLLAFKDFKGDQKFKEAFSEKIKSINDIYERGESYAFVGNFGIGKTYAACCLLKKAIISDYSAKYYNMSDIITKVLNKNDPDTLKELTEIDFLVIDEFSKRFIFASEKSEQIFGQTMEQILRSRFQNKMPTVICSNNEDIDEVLLAQNSSDFAKAFESLRRKHMTVYYILGNDFRKKGTV